MPKMLIHAPEGLFTDGTRAKVAAELTDLGLDCEKLPKTPFVKSTVWCYFADYPLGSVFTGGVPATVGIMSLVVYTLEGGLDGDAKRCLIAGATEILGRHSGISGRIPAYIVILEVPALNWGIFGEPGNLQALRDISPDTPPL